MGNPAASFCGLLVGGQSHRRRSLCNLTRGKLGQGREDEFGLAHVIAKILAIKTFQVFVLLDRDARPFFVNDIGEDGELLPLLYLVSSPVVGQLVARVDDSRMARSYAG